ncbi:MAG: DUF4124 domain-containing protein [Woeseiaceae bacterium]
MRDFNKKLLAMALLAVALAPAAHADIWKWVDANGKTHFVDSKRPIYTWVDDNGKLHYADSPEHEDAVSVELVWHSEGTLEDTAAASSSNDGGYAYPGETAEDRAERERAEEYYCKRATEIYESYLNAPQLYETDANGKRQYLSKADAARTIAETRKKKDELCN